jgi:circadian clock protein KaiC
MISGASGTGKSTTALSFIVQGAKQNERGLYVSFEEPVANLIEHGEAFGWHMKEFVDKGLIKIVHVDVEPHNVDQQFFEIGKLLAEYKPARFVMDSVTPFEKNMSDEEFMEHMKRWAYYNAANGITLVFTVTSEPTASMTGTGVSSFVDNIISLRDVELESALRRSMIIFKARGTAHDRDIREFEITSKGMIVKEKFVGVEQILGGAARRSMTEKAARTLAEAFGGKRK